MIWNYLKTHLFYVVIISIGLLAFHSWVQEHDARLLALQQEKISEQKAADLQALNQQLQAETARQVQAIRQKASTVKTPAQAVAVIPQLAPQAPLQPEVVTTEPDKVAVAALPLVQALAECQETKVELGSCQLQEKNDQAIVVEKDKEIVALKKPKGFWRRLGGALKVAGIAFGVGVGVGGHL